MQTFLLWRIPEADDADSTIARVRDRLIADVREQFDATPDVVTIHQAGWALVYLELAVGGWSAPFLERDDRGWALSLDFPVDADRAVRPDDDGDTYLTRFASALRARPAYVLATTSPPFVLIHGDHGADDIQLHNDGLGFAQLLEYDDGRVHAVTNRPLALRALDVTLEPVPAEWGARALLGWVPTDKTGYRHLSVIPPATGLRFTAGGVERTSHAVLERWLATDHAATDELLDRAADSVRSFAVDAARFWTRAGAGLSAGLDSRSVVATMVAADVAPDFVRTHGHPSNQEMIIARHLGATLDVPHVLQTGRGFPPERDDELRRCVKSALRWQAGMMENKAHKSFNMGRTALSPGNVNIMGKHGEIGRGYYYRRAGAPADGDASGWRDGLLGYLADKPDAALLRRGVRDDARDLIATSVDQASAFGLTGHAALDFYYLYERTRRWASGTIYNQTGKVVTPFLNPGYLRAVFQLSSKDKASSRVHHHIVQRCRPRVERRPLPLRQGGQEMVPQEHDAAAQALVEGRARPRRGPPPDPGPLPAGARRALRVRQPAVLADRGSRAARRGGRARRSGQPRLRSESPQDVASRGTGRDRGRVPHRRRPPRVEHHDQLLTVPVKKPLPEG